MKYIVSPLWAIVTTMILFGISQSQPRFLEILELKWFDQLLIKEVVQDDSVVVVDIGEEALINHGQFPFPRDVYGNVIKKLRSANAGTIVLAMSFPEQDRTTQDLYFKKMLPEGVVLAHYPDNYARTSAYATGIVEIGERAAPFVPHYKGIIGNIPEYEALASGIGIANTIPEIDGLVRRLPMISESNGTLYPSIILEAMKVSKQTKTYQIKTNAAGIQAVRVRGYKKIITDPNGRIWINPNIKNKQFNMDDDFGNLNSATVFIGVTANGISNPVPTANGAAYGHHIIAAAYSSLMMGYSVTHPSYADILRDGSILIIGLLLVGLSYIRYIKIVPILMIPASLICVFYLDFMYNPLNGALSGLLIALHVYGIKYIQEFVAKAQIKKQFGTYLSPVMVAMLQKDPSLLKLGGERKEMTFLFMDIVGFTPISEHYKNKDDPEGLVSLVNEFLDAMTKIIINNGGTIDKYMGDCIMAFWNAPLPCENHAEMAVKSAIEIEAKTNELKDVYKARGLPDINVGTGVNTGDCIVGNMGSDSRFDYSVIGDAVNLAARLEATAARHEYVDYKTIVSSYTVEQLGDGYECKEIGDIKVKGKEELIKIYSPINIYK